MRIFSRQIVVSKSCEEVGRILKCSAYYFPEAKFEGSRFSMYCARRHNGGYLSLTHVKGTILELEDVSRVNLEIHADITALHFFIGCVVVLLGVLGLLYCMITCLNSLLPCVGVILLGLLMGCPFLWESAELLKRIERKLLSID